MIPTRYITTFIIFIFCFWYTAVNNHVKSLYSEYNDIYLEDTPDLGLTFIFFATFPFIILLGLCVADELISLYTRLQYMYNFFFN